MDEQNYRQRLEMFSSSLREKLKIYRTEKTALGPFSFNGFQCRLRVYQT